VHDTGTQAPSVGGVTLMSIAGASTTGRPVSTAGATSTAPPSMPPVPAGVGVALTPAEQPPSNARARPQPAKTLP
jgi:hypothetical protein